MQYTNVEEELMRYVVRGTEQYELYPATPAFDGRYIDVGNGHKIWCRLHGNPDAPLEAVVLHGGPFAACTPRHAQFFDPALWRVLLIDQPACGRSTPVRNIRSLDTKFIAGAVMAAADAYGFARPVWVGRSWGSFLGLCLLRIYAHRFSGYVFGGLWSGRHDENVHMYGGGVAKDLPLVWRRFIAPVAVDQRQWPPPWYEDAMTDALEAGDESEALRLAFEVALYETCVDQLVWEATPEIEAGVIRSGDYLALALGEMRFVRYNLFMNKRRSVLQDLVYVPKMPGVLVNGARDALCPPVTALLAHERLAGSELMIIPDAGHSTWWPGIRGAHVVAIQRVARALLAA